MPVLYKMPQTSLEITGTLRDRYIQDVALLYMLDPVRGEPTAYGLDHDSSSVHGSFDLSLKRKFLDAIALICAVNKSPSCISAACFDKENPVETIIRVASNGGVLGRTLIYMEEILGILTDLSMQGIQIQVLLSSQANGNYKVTPASSLKTEVVILDKIIHLTKLRIQHYVKSLRKANIPDYDEQDLRSMLSLAMPQSKADAIQAFIDWFGRLSNLRASVDETNSENLLTWIRWAEKARPCYLKALKVVVCGAEKCFPRWMSYVFKLGRYSVAARILVKTAVEIPEMFATISVQPVSAPRSVPFAISPNEKPLLSVLRRLPEITADQTLDNLARIWSTNDPEQLFSNTCESDLVVHAELQIVSFYEENRHLMPLSRFIGVSKKSCYMCSTFLAYHPAGFSASACHQKLYLSLPPTSTSPKVYKRFKELTTQICVRLETIAKEELNERFGLKRDYSPADSTAGVTFPGSINTDSWESVSFRDHAELESETSPDEDSGAPLHPHSPLSMTSSTSSRATTVAGSPIQGQFGIS